MLKYIIGILIFLALLRLIKASMKLIITLIIIAAVILLLMQFGILEGLGL